MQFDTIILDTETTDISDSREVIELAWKAHGAEAGGVYRFLPKKEISIGALATHHILLEDLQGKFPSSRASTFVPKAGYWIGHNIDFDWESLGSPKGIKRICTLAMARSEWPQVDKHTLVACTYLIRGATKETREAVRGAHGAEVDIELCANILDYFVKKYSLKTAQEVYAFSEKCRIPKVFSFGKFKGQPISACDRGYANWYNRLEDADPYVLAALKKAGKL